MRHVHTTASPHALLAEIHQIAGAPFLDEYVIRPGKAKRSDHIAQVIAAVDDVFSPGEVPVSDLAEVGLRGAISHQAATAIGDHTAVAASLLWHGVRKQASSGIVLRLDVINDRLQANGSPESALWLFQGARNFSDRSGPSDAMIVTQIHLYPPRLQHWFAQALSEEPELPPHTEAIVAGLLRSGVRLAAPLRERIIPMLAERLSEGSARAASLLARIAEE